MGNQFYMQSIKIMEKTIIDPKFFGADVYVISVTDKIQAITKCNIIFMNSFYDEDNMLHISLELVQPKGKKIVSSSEIHSIIEDSIRANLGNICGIIEDSKVY